MVDNRSQRGPLKIISKFNVEVGVFNIARNTKRVLVKNKSLKSSSKKWLERHINDEYTTKARIFGFRSRSAFKLIEINEKFDIFNLGRKIVKNDGSKVQKVLDLGCAPGGWSEVVLKQTNAKVVGVDLLPIKPLDGLEFYEGDFCSSSVQDLLLKHGVFDLIISDIAPNTSGLKSVDSLSLIAILESELAFIPKFLKKGGCFVCKVFGSGAEKTLLLELKKSFEFVKHFKPKSSRKESNEFYLVCLNFKF